MQHHVSHPSFGAVASTTKVTANERWALMAEKCANRMLTKDMFVHLNKINDIFQRKQVQQELILSSLSQMQLKSFLDISMNNSFNMMIN